MPASATTITVAARPSPHGGVDDALAAAPARGRGRRAGRRGGGPGGRAGRRPPRRPRPRPAPRGPWRVQLAERRVAHGVGGGGVGVRPDDDGARLGQGLQPAGGVDDVAHRGGVAAGPQRADEHLAGVDADPHAQARRRRPRRPSRPRVRCMRSAARTARSASSSWATGAPKRARRPSPTILSTRPPKSAMSAASRSKQRSTRFLTCSGSRRSASVVNPTRSANSTVTTRRSSPRCTSGWPQLAQNRASGAATAPQAPQVTPAVALSPVATTGVYGASLRRLTPNPPCDGRRPDRRLVLPFGGAPGGMAQGASPGRRRAARRPPVRL